jgi:hypothetical protein
MAERVEDGAAALEKSERRVEELKAALRETLYGPGYNPDHGCTLNCNPDNCHRSAAALFEEDADGG